MQPAAPAAMPAPAGQLPVPDSATVEQVPEQVPEGQMPAEAGGGPWQDGSPWQDGPGCNGPNCGGGCDGSCGGSCDSCCQSGGRGFGLCGGNCGGCGGCLGCLLPQSWQLLGGVQGFKGPVDRGNNGNFGFHAGFNLGGMFKPDWGLCYQLGGNFVESNLQGDSAAFTRTSSRDQQFYTVGLFKRSAGCGFQGGVVWDILQDDYYLNMSLQQLRGELSFVGPGLREFGFMFAAGLNDDFGSAQGINDLWTPTDQYAFFYRRQFGCGGQFRVWAGFTGQSDGLLGGEFNVPLSNTWALASNFNYLIPDENGVSAISEEAWALGINLVWYPGGGAKCLGGCRPLFNVADNASFLVDRQSFATTQAN